MKLITLNVWGGILKEPLFDFLRNASGNTDIFCFQEVSNGAPQSFREAGESLELFRELEGLLPGHKGYFTEQSPGVGVATFVRKSIGVEKVVSHIVLTQEDLSHRKMPDGRGYYARPLQIVTLENPCVSIFNFHGVPGDDKKDNADRALQEQRLMGFLDNEQGSKILVGDFNLNPDTLCVAALEKKMRNLIKGSTFATTRSSHYKRRKEVPFADYIFTSNDLHIVDFKVLSDEVSDHLPLMVKF